VVTSVADNPAYFITDQTMNRKVWFVNVLYETTLANLNFMPSGECINIKFVNQAEIQGMNIFPSVKKLAEMFKPENHR